MKPRIVATASTVTPPDIPKHFAAKLRRADDFIRLGVAAAAQVYPDTEENLPGHRTGLFVGTAFGPMQTNFEVLGLIVDEDQTSPTLFSHSVFNSAAGYIARLFNISGSSFTFTDFTWPFFRALAEGYHAIESDLLDHCLVLQVESYSPLLLDALQRTGGKDHKWSMGAVAWHLSSSGNNQGPQIEHIEIESKPATSDAMLHRNEELHSGSETKTFSTPLAAARDLTERIKQPGATEQSCKITAPYGSVSVTFTP